MEPFDADESLENPRFWTKRKVWLVMVLIFLGAGGGFGSKVFYRHVKSWRARQMALQARNLGEENRWAEAFQKASIAYRLDPRGGEVLRVTAQLYARMGLEESLRFGEELLSTSQATTEDRCEYIRMAMHLQRGDLAGEEVRRLLGRLPDEPAVLKVAAEWSAREGRHSVAVSYARAACAPGLGDNSARILLARMLLSSKDPLEESEAKQVLWKVAEQRGEGFSEACSLLVRVPGMTSMELQSLFDLLLRKTDLIEADRLLIEEVGMRLHPESRASRLDSIVKSCKGAGLDRLLATGRWLNRQREFRGTLDVISLEDSVRHRELFLIRMDALAALNRWEEVERLLKDRKAPLDPPLLELFLARAAKEQNNLGDLETHWHRFFSLSIPQPPMLWYGAQYAEKIGEREEAKKIYGQLAQKPITAHQAYASLVRMLEEEGDTAGLRDLMEGLVRQYPKDPSPLNDLSYLDLLLKRNMAQAKENAVWLVEKRPHLLAFRTTLALAYLRFEDPVSAYQMYDSVSVDWSQALPGWQAVYAAVLGANGRRKAAMEVVRQIPLKRLKPEERILVQDYLPK